MPPLFPPRGKAGKRVITQKSYIFEHFVNQPLLNKFLNISHILIIIYLIILSCTSRKNEAERKDIIPQDKMTDIITDLYITDGLLVMPIVHQWYDTKKDTLSAYKDVISSHGYTKDEFDKTLRYYFIKKPKQLMKMYEQALARLSEMETRYDQEATQLQSRLSNYWNGPQTLASPGNTSDSSSFNIKLDFWNIYYIAFTATVFPDDQTVNPKPVIYTCNSDSIESGTRYYVKTLAYIKDGMPHRYQYRINDPVKTRLRIMGDLFDSGTNPLLQKHFIIENISLAY